MNELLMVYRLQDETSTKYLRVYTNEYRELFYDLRYGDNQKAPMSEVLDYPYRPLPFWIRGYIDDLIDELSPRLEGSHDLVSIEISPNHGRYTVPV